MHVPAGYAGRPAHPPLWLSFSPYPSSPAFLLLSPYLPRCHRSLLGTRSTPYDTAHRLYDTAHVSSETARPPCDTAPQPYGTIGCTPACCVTLCLVMTLPSNRINRTFTVCPSGTTPPDAMRNCAENVSTAPTSYETAPRPSEPPWLQTRRAAGRLLRRAVVRKPYQPHRCRTKPHRDRMNRTAAVRTAQFPCDTALWPLSHASMVRLARLGLRLGPLLLLILRSSLGTIQSLTRGLRRSRATSTHRDGHKRLDMAPSPW
jgi:hypothetical protein